MFGCRLAAACLLVSLSIAGCTETESSSSTAALDCSSLRALADRTGIFLGGAFVEGREDPLFRETLAREFNSTTVPLYWSESQPAPGVFNFAAADAGVAAADASGLRMRGHPLIWGRLALPDYVRNETDPDVLRTMMRERIDTILTRYRGKIAQYDVVNEPITLLGAAGQSNGVEPYVFYRLLGVGYIREALEMARAADPDARLFVNEFFVERPGDKQDRFYDLIKQLVDDGAPIDGVGFQGHIQLPLIGTDYRPTRTEMEQAIRRFADLGLEVEITEVDVTIANRSACQLDFQRRMYADVMHACLAVSACTGVTTWAISDRYTWIKNSFSVDGAPLLFDESFAPKPAYFGVRNALLQQICSGDPCDPSCIGRCDDQRGCPDGTLECAP